MRVQLHWDQLSQPACVLLLLLLLLPLLSLAMQATMEVTRDVLAEDVIGHNAFDHWQLVLQPRWAVEHATVVSTKCKSCKHALSVVCCAVCAW
jgi:ABC-type spermidine/putrescine transport system permease subunit I